VPCGPTPRRGLGAYRTIRRAAGGLYRIERVDFSLSRPRLPLPPLFSIADSATHRVVPLPRGEANRMTFPDEFSLIVSARDPPLASSPARESQSSCATRRRLRQVSASNKNLRQIGRIVQFYLPRCPPRNVC